MKPYPYQSIGEEWLAPKPAAILGDDPGLGKTGQAVLAIKRMSPWDFSKGILIVCPAHLKLNWQREWEMWMGEDCGAYPAPVILSYTIAAGKRASKPGAKRKVRRTKSVATTQEWDVVIFDEAHYLKNPSAWRTKQLLGQMASTGPLRPGGQLTISWKGGVQASKAWYLTGTPITTGPKDFFNLLNRCAPHLFPNRMAYEQMYCEGRYGEYGWQADGACNMAELRDKILAADVMLRRLKGDVLTQLPPKRRQILEIPKDQVGLDKEDKIAMAKAEEVFADALAWEGVTSEQLANDGALYMRIMTKIHAGFEAKMGTIAGGEGAENAHDLRLLLAPSKVKAFEVLAKADLKENPHEQVVVWAHYHSTVDLLCETLDKPNISYAKFTGRENPTKRSQAVTDFQAGKVQVIVCSSAAYTGITLTAASRAIIVEASSIPSDNVQAEDRIHRIGQEDSVLIQYLVIEGSYDVKVMKTAVERLCVNSELLDGKVLTNG